MSCCKRVRRDIALWIGNDLDPARRIQVQRHIRECEPCRAHSAALKNSITLLSRVDCEAAEAGSESVWPAVEARLARCRVAPGSHRFNGWAVAAGVAAAWLIVVAASRWTASPEPAPTMGEPRPVFTSAPVDQATPLPALDNPHQIPRQDDDLRRLLEAGGLSDPLPLTPYRDERRTEIGRF